MMPEAPEEAGRELTDPADGPRQPTRRPRRAQRPPTGQVPQAPASGSTRDDTDAGWGEAASDPARDQWLAEQRPPHWGRD